MAYGAVDRQTWNDERFRSWDRDVRDVWLYLLTSPHGNRLGCFVLSTYYVADDVQISPDRARECLEFLDRERRIVWDGENRVVCIVRHLHPDYNPLANQNVVKAAVKELKALPSSERALGALFWAVEKWGRPHYDELSQALENRLPNGSREIRESVEEPFPEFTRVTLDPDPDPDQEPERRDGGSLPDGRSPPGEPAVENPRDGNRWSGTVTACRKHLWLADDPPFDRTVGQELSVAKQLTERWNLDPPEVAEAVEGFAALREQGEWSGWVEPKDPASLLALNRTPDDEQGIPVMIRSLHEVRKAGPTERSGGMERVSA